MNIREKMEWDDKYSVGVKEIDNQHKLMFKTINELIDAVGTSPTKENITAIIVQLVQYKKFHFATEEKYFIEFKYEKMDEHVSKHKFFSTRLDEIQKKCGDDVFELAFELVDFLEDWLIEHLMTADQEYKECFKSHGLK